MQLFVATEEEVHHWIRILDILIDMKNQNINMKNFNPF